MQIYSHKIEQIVSEISGLTLLEVADLNSALKERLNIPDAAPVAAMHPGMMMAAPPQVQSYPYSISLQSSGCSA